MFRNIEIERITPYKGNPRQITQAAIESVAQSIEMFGFQQPIVVDKDYVIIVGHTRHLAARKLGLSKVPVIVADLSEDEAAAYRISDNRTAEFSNWDLAALTAEFGDISIDVPGFSQDEITMLLTHNQDTGDIEYEAPKGAWDAKDFDKSKYRQMTLIVQRQHARKIRDQVEQLIDQYDQ